MTENNKKIQYIDIARGLLIILVVIGHGIVAKIQIESVFYKKVFSFIYLFHMAAFFMISGFLFAKKLESYKANSSVKGGWQCTLIIKKFKYLFVPYVTWSLLNYIIVIFGNNIPKVGILLTKAGFKTATVSEMFFSIISYENHFDRHIWFVYALFIIFALVTLFYKLFCKASTLVVVIILYAVMTRFFNPVEIIDRVIYYLFYFCLGMQTKWFEKWIKANKKTIILVLVIFIVSAYFCLMWNYFDKDSYFIKTFDIWFSTGKYAAAISGSLLTIKISQFIVKYCYLNRLLNFLSCYSYDIYLIHNPFIVNGISYLFLLIGTSNTVAIFGSAVIGLIVSIIVSKYVLRKNRILSICFLGR